MSINNILIIEDDAFQRNVMVKMMSKISSARISVAVNGQDALTRLDTLETPDLILCDLSMPEMDGIEFLRRVAERQLYSKVALTSAAAIDVVASVKQMALSYGITNVTSVAKPVHRQQLQQLLKQTDNELHHEKSNRKPRYQPSDRELIDALDNGQLVPFFQPHIDAKSEQIVGAEALVRWQHPTQSILAPDVFLNRIMQLGLSHKLTRCILEASVAACARWHSHGFEYLVSVNVSPSDLTNLDFADEVLRVLEHYGLPKQFLTLEVTETEICPNQAKTLDTLTRLRINGINIAIDDFGTGHSSLIQLITSPFTELKIDQFFIREMFEDSKHLAAVKASLVLANHLGLKTVAEGVETAEHAAALKEMNCDVLQGYCYSPALPEGKFLDWCQQHKHVTGQQHN